MRAWGHKGDIGVLPETECMNMWCAMCVIDSKDTLEDPAIVLPTMLALVIPFSSLWSTATENAVHSLTSCSWKPNGELTLPVMRMRWTGRTGVCFNTVTKCLRKSIAWYPNLIKEPGRRLSNVTFKGWPQCYLVLDIVSRTSEPELSFVNRRPGGLEKYLLFSCAIRMVLLLTAVIDRTKKSDRARSQQTKRSRCQIDRGLHINIKINILYIAVLEHGKWYILKKKKINYYFCSHKTPPFLILWSSKFEVKLSALDISIFMLGTKVALENFSPAKGDQ